MFSFASRILVFCFGLSLASAAGAAEVLLTIRTPEGAQLYDRARLEAFPQVTVITHTSVTDGPQTFVGPLMRDLMADAGVVSDTVLAIALNDYEIDLPLDDFETYDVIAALTMNGEVMTPRDKGPIWIVYPRDEHRVLQDIDYDYRWVWQLTRIEAK